MNKIVLRGLRVVAALLALDIVILLATGGYAILGTSLRSQFPCTSVFLLLLTILLYQVLSHRASRAPWTEREQALVLFLSLWLVYLSNFRWRGSGDVVAASLLPFSILQDGSIQLDRFTQIFLGDPSITWIYSYKGHVYSIFSSANGILLIPFYALSACFKVIPTDHWVHQLQKVGASGYVAASGVLMFWILRRFTSWSWALLLTVAYALGTSTWSTSSQAIWQHGPSEFFLSLGLYAIFIDKKPRAPALAGFALAMAVWCRYTDLLLYLPIAAWYLFYSRDKVLRFIAGSLLPVAFLLGDNWLHSGELLKTGQHMVGEEGKFSSAWIDGFPGILLSPARGLFLFSPFLIAGFIGGLREVWKPTQSLFRYLTLGVMIHLSLYAQWYDWGGGWCYGPRMLSDIMPFMVLLILPMLPFIDQRPALKRFFKYAVGYSILMHAVGAFLTWDWENPALSLWAWQRHPIGYLLNLLRVRLLV